MTVNKKRVVDELLWETQHRLTELMKMKDALDGLTCLPERADLGFILPKLQAIQPPCVFVLYPDGTYLVTNHENIHGASFLTDKVDIAPPAANSLCPNCGEPYLSEDAIAENPACGNHQSR